MTTSTCLNLDSRFWRDSGKEELQDDVHEVHAQVDTIEEFQFLTVGITVLQLIFGALNAFAAYRNLKHSDDYRLPAVTRARRRSVLKI